MTPHSGTFVAHEESRVHSGESWSRMSIQLLRGEKDQLGRGRRGEAGPSRPRPKSREVDPVMEAGD